MKKLIVVGAGLIGTSIALGAKRNGLEVQLFDSDLRAQRLANDLLNNDEVTEPDLVVIATPVSSIQTLFSELIKQYPKACFIDTASVKSKVEVDIKGFDDLAKNFCPSHPMAGREVDGAEGAQSDLFVGRTWVITPLPSTSQLAKSRAKELIKILGATAVEMTPINHDQAVAKVSHLPQVIASLLAAQLVDGSEDQLRLAGGGLIDTTRIADSNPKLWREILLNNRDALMPLLLNFQKDLSTLISDLDSQTLSVLQRGNDGRNRLPGKHHKQKRDYVYLPVVIDDKPGQLAKLFDECASVEVGVEDLSIEHSPEQETGLITLALSPEGAKKLELHLKTMNWRVHPPRSEK